MMRKRMITFAVFLLATIAGAVTVSAETNDDDYEAQNKAVNWYADRCESIITRFEGLRYNSGELPQKYCVVPSADAGALKYALLVSTWDNRRMVMYTPDGQNVKAKVTDKSVVPEDVYWEAIYRLLSHATHSTDITLSKRPMPVRHVDKEHNSFTAVVDYEDKVSNIRRYNQMMFKPHVNEVRLAKEDRYTKKDEDGQAIIDEMKYEFKLKNPSVVAKMFRGYENEEMTPWIVTNDFFTDHQVQQFSRWKEGEPIVKATSDACRMISSYYGGRRIKDTRWMATVPESERHFYAVQFEIADGDALAAIVCIGEGEVVSSWEFHGSMTPEEYKDGQSIWFVDDGGDFMEHVPELQCIVVTQSGLELYLRVFGGESVQYYVLREVGGVLMMVQVDYWIYVWE